MRMMCFMCHICWLRLFGSPGYTVDGKKVYFLAMTRDHDVREVCGNDSYMPPGAP